MTGTGERGRERLPRYGACQCQGREQRDQSRIATASDSSSRLVATLQEGASDQKSSRTTAPPPSRWTASRRLSSQLKTAAQLPARSRHAHHLLLGLVVATHTCIARTCHAAAHAPICFPSLPLPPPSPARTPQLLYSSARPTQTPHNVVVRLEPR